MMEYRLQNLLIPNPAICPETTMYYRSQGDVVQDGKVLRLAKHAACSFDTYFNAFSLNKWREYTGISNLSLRLRLKGTFELRLEAAEWYRRRVQRSCIFVKAVIGDGARDILLPIEDLSGENLCFSLWALSEDAEFQGGSYVTEVEEGSLRPVEIDLVMCTYRREAFVERNVRLLEEEFFPCEDYNGARHFQIRIVDNGKTLPASITQGDPRIHLDQNLNVGGAGGFARGMMESLSAGQATHILFMDDDVTIQVEALERTYNLLVLLKEEYRDRFLSGAMLRLDRPSCQHVSGEYVAGRDIRALKGFLDLSEYKNVVFNEKYEGAPQEHAAWWYCCIPVGIARLDNLPMPFFVRGDDVEYSMRNIKRILTLNGISVWHAAFERKYSTLMENYFMFRNQSVAILLHHPIGRIGYLKFFLRRFAREVFRYDYAAADLLFDGIERVLQGPDFFIHNDTVRDLKEHAARQTKLRPLSDLTEEICSYQEYRNALKKKRESKLVKAVRFLTLNGHFLPGCFFRQQGYAEYGYLANSKHFFRYRRIFACNLNFDEGVVLEMNRVRCLRQILRFVKDFLRVAFGWHHLEQQYKDAFPYMTSEAFWRKYLKLDN